MVDDGPRYRPLSRRRRLGVALLAVATASTLILMMLERVGAPELPRPADAPASAASAPAPCPPGQDSGCVGGRAEVFLLPATTASAAGR